MSSTLSEAQGRINSVFVYDNVNTCIRPRACTILATVARPRNSLREDSHFTAHHPEPSSRCDFSACWRSIL